MICWHFRNVFLVVLMILMKSARLVRSREGSRQAFTTSRQPPLGFASTWAKKRFARTNSSGPNTESRVGQSLRCSRLQQPGSYAYGTTRNLSAANTSPPGNIRNAASDFFAPPEESFESIGISSPVLLSRIRQNLGLTRPSAVQAAAYNSIVNCGTVTIGAETGSGKTLAYLLPLLDDVLQRKEKGKLGYDYGRALILVPNKELVQQVVRMAVDLCGGSEQSLVTGVSSNAAAPSRGTGIAGSGETVDETEIVRLAVMPGGLKEPEDFPPFRYTKALGGSDPPVDIVISTPAAVGPLALKPKNINLFADIETLIVDEADMLLDGGYIRALENVLMGFRRADKLDASLGVKKTQHVFVAATLPDMGLRSVEAFLQKKFPDATRVTMAGMHNARHYGLHEHTVWIEEDEEGNRGRMKRFVELLQTPKDNGGLEKEKVMVFLNSVDDVDGAATALGRAGIQAVPYHAKISLAERADNLDRFRRYQAGIGEEANDSDAVPVLVCTDLASRGLDVPGVTVVVQLQFAGNVVAHLHRMGRCGRAGKRDGRGIIFFGVKERELVAVVREAEQQQDRMILEGDVDATEESDDGEASPRGSVEGAFSRKRGFTKKRKKLRKEALSDDHQ